MRSFPIRVCVTNLVMHWMFGSSFSDFKLPVCRIGSQVVDAKHVFGGLSCFVGALSRSGMVSLELSGTVFCSALCGLSFGCSFVEHVTHGTEHWLVFWWDKRVCFRR